jgi:hypothetical protein
VTFFQEADKLSSVSACPMMESALAMLSVQQPVTFVEVALGRSPYAKAILGAVSPLALKDLSIVPGECSIALSNSINELALINAVNIFFTTVGLLIIFVLSFKDGSFGDHEPFSAFLVVYILSKEDAVIGRNYFEVLFPD